MKNYVIKEVLNPYCVYTDEDRVFQFEETGPELKVGNYVVEFDSIPDVFVCNADDITAMSWAVQESKGRSARREAAYDAIDSERDYQDAGDKKEMSLGEFILCMAEYLDQARSAWSAWYRSDSGVKSLDSVRKVAALATWCMEMHGAVHREPACYATCPHPGECTADECRERCK